MIAALLRLVCVLRSAFAPPDTRGFLAPIPRAPPPPAGFAGGFAAGSAAGFAAGYAASLAAAGLPPAPGQEVAAGLEVAPGLAAAAPGLRALGTAELQPLGETGLRTPGE
ncbi:hypothetical protein T492DRAFT_858559 [Pavlovales sp. CCMP2436]|nr:hypothetical protein T492DRAFT_858559 [Pavlovales sp. CCMP2436]